MTDPAFIIWKYKYNYPQCWFTEVLLSVIGKNKLNRSKSPIVCKKKKELEFKNVFECFLPRSRNVIETKVL